MIDESTKAYWAGIVDLVGLIRLRTSATGSLPVLQVHGPYVEILQQIADATATKVITVTRSYARAGCNEHCKSEHIHVHSFSARWSLTGAKATVVLHNLEPYLRQKQQMARITLDYGLMSTYKPATMDKMKALGWALPEMRGKAA